MGATDSKLTPQEQMRAHKRQITRAVRELDRERSKLQLQEKKLITEIKKLARQGQEGSVRILARDLVRVRSNVTKFYNMKSQLQAVEMRLQTIKSTHAMSEALKGVGKSMVQFNKAMNLPELNSIMQEFSRENQRMEMTEEMMGDAVDMAMGGEDDISATDDVVNQVLSEIGVEIGAQLETGPMRQLNRPVQEEVKSSESRGIEARFNALR